jgi:superfamily II DNA or RNA helicase
MTADARALNLDGVTAPTGAGGSRHAARCEAGAFAAAASAPLIESERTASATKIVIASRFNKVLESLHAWLESLGIPSLLYLGKTSDRERGIALTHFASPNVTNAAPTRVLLLATEAGGVGISLPGARALVLIDSSWTASSEQQVVDRIVRLNSPHKEVFIIKVVGNDPLEKAVDDKAANKARAGEELFEFIPGEATPAERKLLAARAEASRPAASSPARKLLAARAEASRPAGSSPARK